MPNQDIRVTIRVNRELKESAETLFEYLGLNMTTAVNIFLRKTVDQRGIPFPVNIGNQKTTELNADEATKVFSNAIKQSAVQKQEKGLPVARYDAKTKQAYPETTDGL
jgi:DNA-damage-inducible protein J